MRIAFFSPMPPVKSGIADYAAALVPAMEQQADVTVFTEVPPSFKPADFDICLYQIGNNPHHIFTYEMAMRHPGVVVMHESNLHHLIADLTIKRGDWDAYLREVEYEGGVSALNFAHRVRALEVGPDYEGVPMLRRVLSNSKGAIVHSRCVAGDLRTAGFPGPVGVIPHGSWIVEQDGRSYRERLGVAPGTPLIGIFGFLKPYKRIAESLRAFRRLIRQDESAKMILVGEPHPDLRLPSLLQSLDLHAHVRVLGFTEIEDFNGYLAACDVILNLRFPTVGESSGTLLRAFGMGKSVIVSDIGSFSEFPDEVCLKTPVDETEEYTIFEYLSMLTNRPELRRTLGHAARAWVEANCRWDHVAGQYISFLHSVARGEEWPPNQPEASCQPATGFASEAPSAAPAADSSADSAGVILSWAPPTPESRSYLDIHLSRLAKTLDLIPPGTADDRILEMGAYLQITPALKTKLGYGDVRGCYYGVLGRVDHKEVHSADGEVFTCEIDLFDAEKDVFPYPDNSFKTVVCGELLEHLTADPFHMMSEINRILKPGGHLVLTTPNICSLRALKAILTGYHPGFFQAYIRPGAPDEETEARHNREYTPREIEQLLRDSGFSVERIETGEFRDEPKPEHNWVQHLLTHFDLPTELRGDDIYAVGRKTGPIQHRYPPWLYA